jgi:hypothetical protein
MERRMPYLIIRYQSQTCTHIFSSVSFGSQSTDTLCIYQNNSECSGMLSQLAATNTQIISLVSLNRNLCLKGNT